MTVELWWCAVGVVGTAATVAATVRVLRPARLGWAFVSAGAVVVCVTGIVSGFLDLTGGRLSLLLVAPGLLAYPLLVSGLLLIRRAVGWLHVTDVLDALVAALGAFLIGWMLIWHAHYLANGVLVTTTVIHPVGALVVFSAAVTVAMSRCLGRRADALLVAAAAVLLAMTSVLAVTVTKTSLGVTRIPAVPALWALFPLLLAATGVLRWSPRPVTPVSGPVPLTRWRVALIVVCAVLGPIAWVVIVTSDPPERALSETVIPVATDAVLSLLVLTRLVLTGTALQRIRAQLTRMATRDPLTGLPNRAALRTALDETFALDSDRMSALLLLDLDGFKQINDRLGHLVGDAVLLSVADRVRHAVPATAIVARLGGDEFAVVLPDTDVQLMTAVAGRIHADLRRTYAVHGHELELSASIGVVHTNGGPATPTEALRHADIAMYQAKAAGRDQWVVYSE